MRTYAFTYSVKLPSGDSSEELPFVCDAIKLSSAIKLFDLFNKNFPYLVCSLNPQYTVINSVGMKSSRLLPAKYLKY